MTKDKRAELPKTRSKSNARDETQIESKKKKKQLNINSSLDKTSNVPKKQATPSARKGSGSSGTGNKNKAKKTANSGKTAGKNTTKEKEKEKTLASSKPKSQLIVEQNRETYTKLKEEDPVRYLDMAIQIEQLKQLEKMNGQQKKTKLAISKASTATGKQIAKLTTPDAAVETKPIERLHDKIKAKVHSYNLISDKEIKEYFELEFKDLKKKERDTLWEGEKKAKDGYKSRLKGFYSRKKSEITCKIVANIEPYYETFPMDRTYTSSAIQRMELSGVKTGLQKFFYVGIHIFELQTTRQNAFEFDVDTTKQLTEKNQLFWLEILQNFKSQVETSYNKGLQGIPAPSIELLVQQEKIQNKKRKTLDSTNDKKKSNKKQKITSDHDSDDEFDLLNSANNSPQHSYKKSTFRDSDDSDSSDE